MSLFPIWHNATPRQHRLIKPWRPLFKTHQIPNGCRFAIQLGAWLLSFLLLSYGWAGAADATTIQLQWQGEGGYQVTADMQYPDEVSNGVAAIDGIGDSKNLEQLDVKFTDPTHRLLATYANVESGQSRQDKYLQFHYDIAQQQLLGWLDIGGAIAEDYYLKGQPGTQLTLFHLDAEGNELTLDNNQGELTILVPEKK